MSICLYARLFYDSLSKCVCMSLFGGASSHPAPRKGHHIVSGARGSTGHVDALVGASAIGYGVGFGSLATLQALRRQLIAYLLTYELIIIASIFETLQCHY